VVVVENDFHSGWSFRVKSTTGVSTQRENPKMPTGLVPGD
jgi:hypothetical protein